MQGETVMLDAVVLIELFQSTLPMQGETRLPYVLYPHWHDFNPLSLCRERLLYRLLTQISFDFNPLSLCRERRKCEGGCILKSIFQSTLPMQGETLEGWMLISGINGFQSTLPMQGETGGHGFLIVEFTISIHSPYAGRDRF